MPGRPLSLPVLPPTLKEFKERKAASNDGVNVEGPNATTTSAGSMLISRATTTTETITLDSDSDDESFLPSKAPRTNPSARATPPPPPRPELSSFGTPKRKERDPFLPPQTPYKKRLVASTNNTPSTSRIMLDDDRDGKSTGPFRLEEDDYIIARSLGAVSATTLAAELRRPVSSVRDRLPVLRSAALSRLHGSAGAANPK